MAHGIAINGTGVGKRLELLREVVSGLRRLAILANVGSPIGVLEMREVQATAGTLGLEIATSEVRRAEDITPAFDVLKGRADALYVVAGCRGRSAHNDQSDSHQHLGGGRATADHARPMG